MIAGKRTRSTSAPMTSAPVIAAKLIWKAAKTSSGIALPALPTAQALSPSIPASPALAKPPISALPVAEGEAVVPQHPAQDRDRGDAQHLAHHRQQILGADQPAVEQARGPGSSISMTSAVDTSIHAVSPLSIVSCCPPCTPPPCCIAQASGVAAACYVKASPMAWAAPDARPSTPSPCGRAARPRGGRRR